MLKVATLYHNNRCSKSRAALGLLQERGGIYGRPFEVIEEILE